MQVTPAQLSPISQSRAEYKALLHAQSQIICIEDLLENEHRVFHPGAWMFWLCIHDFTDVMLYG